MIDEDHPLWPLFEDACELAEAGRFETAAALFGILAEAGDPCAQTWLGDTLDSLDRPIEASLWYRRAARAGEVNGAFNHAVLHRNRNRRRGYIRWLRIAAAMGNADAPGLLETATRQDATWWAMEDILPPAFARLRVV